MKKFITFLFVSQMLLSCSNHGDKVTYNATDVYYKDGISKVEADKLGEFLVKNEFANGEGKSVQFVRNQETNNMVFRMIVKDEVANDDSNDVVFKTFALELTKTFNQPVDFEICDNAFKTLKTFYNKDLPKTKQSLSTDIIYYQGVSDDLAQKLADFLERYKYSNSEKKTVVLEKTNENYVLKTVVKPETEKNEANVAIFNFLKDVMKDSVFNGQDFKLHLCNDKLETLKVIE